LHNQDPELLHDLRGAILRIDFALKYLNKWLGANKKIRKTVREVRRRMAKVRDLDIFTLSIKKDLQALNTPRNKQAILKKIIDKKHEEVRRELVEILESPSYKNMLDELELLIGYNKLPHTFPALKRVLKDIDRWKKRKVSVKDLHPLRITFKELRYSCEFMHNEDQLDKIIKFQKILGNRQDAVTNTEILSQLPLNGVSRLRGSLKKKEKAIIHKNEEKFYKRWRKTPRRKFLMLASP
jgi:CHAD domain-containing protein